MARHKLYQRYTKEQIKDSESEEDDNQKKFSYATSSNQQQNQSLNNSYASSEDEQNKRYTRFDSTTSYTSGEDEPNQSSSFGYRSQTSENESISYYNPVDDDPQKQYYTSGGGSGGVKRSFSCTSEEGDEVNTSSSFKRTKLSESNDSTPYPSDNEQQQPTSGTYEPSLTGNDNNGQQSSHFENYSDASRRMMQMMGYKKDTGLGKAGQGRVEPITASMQKGRRGLGLRLDDLDRVADNWDPTIEELSIPEKFEWLSNDEADEYLLHEFSIDQLLSWVHRGPRKITIDNETKFCDENILKRVLESKTVFDNLGAEDMRRARTKSNPFETIRGNIFLNRAAVKMANMDSMFDFMFTNPIDETGKPMLSGDDLLYFADVCAGPGGFSEYVLYRKRWESKGFGFTLRAENDFKLHDFFVGPPETFSPYYGNNEDGNVYDPENIKSFEEMIREETASGVHFMMADGGFSVEGQENIQEILSKQLYLAQCLVALSIVRTKGHFVVKLFDLFTPFSISLIYLMHKCFSKITICKPNTSRPANSERYLVCKWKKPYTDTIQRHLFDINKELWKRKDADMDVLELVPLEVMQNDRDFFDYIYNSNNLIGKNQIVGLMKIAAFCKDPDLNEKKQSEIRKQCLKLWKLPDESRKKPITKSSEQVCGQLLQAKWAKEKFLNAPEKPLESMKAVEHHIKSTLDWYFVGIDVIRTSNSRTFFMSRGRFDVLAYNMTTDVWDRVNDIEMSADTLIYAEIVKELIGESRSQISAQALHIIDGIILGGKDIRHLPLVERNQMCRKFARSLTKPPQCENKSMPIRCKKLFKLADIENFFDHLIPRRLKDGSEKMGYDIARTNNLNTNRFHIPRGLLLLDEVRSDKTRCFSNTQKKFYYFDKMTGKTFFSEFLKHDEKYASFKNTFMNRLVWKFEVREQILEVVEQERKLSDHLYRGDFVQFVNTKTPKINW